MIKRINIALSIEDHSRLFNKKEKMKKELGLDKLSWEEFILKLVKE